ncbi:surface antigen [Sphingomonas vulcanisoli]|uniref:Surface antigen n=1 Tax=Sphingomonas vulcanisoli TaxID=1658060 RepID=A0ABX0TLW0_9SPHN|nr:CHAP domain-containing protein [Sphingomonas vulcanisoli]NIJ06508.1 surface antigen [Sphingomonas vulcanisoli]
MHKSLKVAFAACVMMIGMAAPSAANAQSYLQCAPFARAFSGIQLFGAAAGWWHQATGKYSEGNAPRPGSVLVFKALSSMRSGHVATVTQIVSDRIIKVTHANWGGMKGKIERDVTVVDTSAKNDWSAVRVWYAPIGDVGTKAYPTYGFIYNGAKAVANEVKAIADKADDAIHAGQ